MYIEYLASDIAEQIIANGNPTIKQIPGLTNHAYPLPFDNLNVICDAFKLKDNVDIRIY